MGNQTSAKSPSTPGDDTAPALTDGVDLFDSTGPFYNGRRALEYLLYDHKRTVKLTPTKASPQQGPRLLPTVFKWQGGGKEVAVSGSFNDWKTPIPLAKSHKDFYTIVDLPEGEHEYKFLVDGQWVLNPGEPSAPNGMGTLNNKVLVKKSDFEVFEALALDSQASNKPKAGAEDGGGGSKGYGQVVPVKKEGKQPAPPSLPPQLLQVILNKDTPAHIEPSLLPEPNHVMLNHLYALSIKDGVMVLSATHRFRRKYVTTLLYKPI